MGKNAQFAAFGKFATKRRKTKKYTKRRKKLNLEELLEIFSWDSILQEVIRLSTISFLYRLELNCSNFKIMLEIYMRTKL